MADVPRDLLEQIAQLERLFTVDTAKLKAITDHFVKELEKGMSTQLSLSTIFSNVLQRLVQRGW